MVEGSQGPGLLNKIWESPFIFFGVEGSLCLDGVCIRYGRALSSIQVLT